MRKTEKPIIVAVFFVMIFVALTTFLIGHAQAITLRETFNSPACSTPSCWLGIEPGVTTQSEVQRLFNELGIVYTVNPVSFPPVGTGEENGVYDFIPNNTMPFLLQDAFGSIAFAEGIVYLLQFPVDVPLDMVISEYGAPSHVTVSIDNDYSVVYSDQRMAFNLIGTEQVAGIEIGTQIMVENYFLGVGGSYSFLEDCSAFGASCPVATATPAATPVPSTHNIPAGDVTGLIAAINAANVAPDPDIINLTDGVYTLTAVHNTTDGVNGLPVITSPITINGSAGGATITRDTSAPEFRLFRVAAGGSLTLSDVTLTNGNSGEGFSGGIVSNSGTLTLHHATLSGGYADANGGAIYNDGTLTIDGGSVLSGNTARGFGGAIYSTGVVSLTDGDLSGNTALGDGGAYNARGH